MQGNSEFFIPSWPKYDHDEINAVSAVLKSGKVNYWTGNTVKEFEDKYSGWCGAQFSVAQANGSLALTSCLYACGIRKGDEVITTPRTFVATASSIALLGAVPIFVDVDINTQCIDPYEIEKAITNRTKSIVVVHLGGWPADMEKICEIARAHNLYVIEDCAQAHGAEILVDGNWRSVGTFGDISAWSFCQDKIISTGGEGGMVTTNDDDLWLKTWSLKDHGKSYALTRNNQTKNTGRRDFRWVHESLGTNFRMTEMQAAIGIMQLKKLPLWSNIRNKNASIIQNTLESIEAIHLSRPPKNIRHAWYKFYLFIDENNLKDDWSRSRILDEFCHLGLPAASGSCSEVYLEKCFNYLNTKPDRYLPNARKLGKTSIVLPVHPTIDEYKMKEIAERAKTVLAKSIR